MNKYHKAATYIVPLQWSEYNSQHITINYSVSVSQSGFIQLSGQSTNFNMVLTTYTNSTPISQDGYLPISGQGTNVNNIALANITPVQHGDFIPFSG